MPLARFHPLLQRWFRGRFAGLTEPQQQGWPPIAEGRHTLIAAPTGSGKTLTAFLAAIDRLVQEAASGGLPEEIRVVYVSPLRALSNDMHRNLEAPLAEIAALAKELHLPAPGIRVGLRTGDSSPAQRAKLVRKPPHILVTTPESLYLLLTSPLGRDRLRTVQTIIVDEIHALVRDKRGSHLALSLERLAALTGARPQRIGLSATQRPIEQMARFLVGCSHDTARLEAAGSTAHPGAAGAGDCVIIDVGHQRQLDLAIEVPPSPLGAVCMHEQWAEVNQRLCELINSHRATLVFVNTRRMAERVTHQLTQILGEEAVSSHHGSLAAKLRHDTEQRLKTGQLKAVVATASLELGLDVGFIDLVVQLGSARSIATFLQRVGRSGHALGLVPKGRLFALTRDELLEGIALVRAARAGRLDAVPIPEMPLDILAQQIVAEVACREWSTDELFALVRRAWPYRQLPRDAFNEVLQLLSEGITPSAGRGKVFLHHDQVARRVRARPGARLVAASNGGAIPEIASYRVVAEPDQTVVGTLDEDFASESQAGEIFLLGNTSWRILHVRGNDVTVADAHGAPPTIPFWRGEAPGRTRELSEEVSRLREELEARLDDPEAAARWLIAEGSLPEQAARQAVEYARAQKAALGLLPTRRRIVFERFFDESGGMQLVIHAPFGARITKAWGLAMRKRFCRSFDFELQATADDDGIVLSLGPQHSFPLESMFHMLNAQNVRQLLEQALLYVPTFQTRWRWNVVRALFVERQRNGNKVPPALVRFRADDLLTAVFPKLTGCQENVTGDLELPDHPLARQSMHDCLHEAHDFDGLRAVLASIDAGEIELVARDTREPSPFCYELLNANPYAFLDGGEIAERRTRAVATRRSLSVESLSDLGRLDPAAIDRVCQEAAPWVRSADELHDLLLSRVAVPVPGSFEEPHAARDAGAAMLAASAAWSEFYDALRNARRATTVADGSCRYWVAAERLPAVRAMWPDAPLDPAIEAPEGVRTGWSRTEAQLAMARGAMEVCGPIQDASMAALLGVAPSTALALLEALEAEGVVLRGHFTPAEGRSDSDGGAKASDSAGMAARPVEWCHRRLLARIHRLTMEGLRRQIEPVPVEIFQRFLFRHHGLLPGTRRAGTNGVFEAVAMLQGLDLPAAAWERALLPARVEGYQPGWLDELCLAGEIGWGRLYPARRLPDRARPLASLTRAVPLGLFLRSDLHWLEAHALPPESDPLSSPARQVLDLLASTGAMFAADMLVAARLLPGQLLDVLGELVAQGLVTADGFAGLRMLLAEHSGTDEGRRDRAPWPPRRAPLAGAGRWAIWRRAAIQPPQAAQTGAASVDAAADSAVAQRWAWQLLRRYGVLFRDLLAREPGAPRWFELLCVLRRLEAKGEIRGGRFISGVGGEQFALADTVRLLRQLRDEGSAHELVIISAADPLNLMGVLTSGERVPAIAGNRLAYVDGLPVAALVAQEVRYLVEPSPRLQELLEHGRALVQWRPGEKDISHPQPASPDAGARAARSRQRRLFQW